MKLKLLALPLLLFILMTAACAGNTTPSPNISLALAWKPGACSASCADHSLLATVFAPAGSTPPTIVFYIPATKLVSVYFPPSYMSVSAVDLPKNYQFMQLQSHLAARMLPVAGQLGMYRAEFMLNRDDYDLTRDDVRTEITEIRVVATVVVNGQVQATDAHLTAADLEDNSITGNIVKPKPQGGTTSPTSNGSILTSLEPFALTQTDVDTVRPCKDMWRYDLSGQIQDAPTKPQTDADKANIEWFGDAIQMGWWGIGEYYSGSTSENTGATISNTALRFPSTATTIQWMQDFRAQKKLSLLFPNENRSTFQPLSAPAVGEESTAFQVGSAPVTYLLALRRSNVVVLLTIRSPDSGRQCSIKPSLALLTLLAQAIDQRARNPQPPAPITRTPTAPPPVTRTPTPASSGLTRLPFADDFSSDKGWTNKTSGHFVRDAGKGMLAWHVDRSTDEKYYLPIEPYSGDFTVAVRIQATRWANNCEIYFGLAEELGGSGGDPNWPTGVFAAFGWFGAGVGNRIRPAIMYADGSKNVGWVVADKSTYIQYNLNQWYVVTLAKQGNQWKIQMDTEDGKLRREISGPLPAQHRAYKYIFIGKPRDGDWPTGDGFLDSINVSPF
ncbi:MAG: hypothetical protein WCF84_12280 [Anaerolineae bacterium]